MTFLFADIRGFTQFTQRAGAEAAARLADFFIAMGTAVAGDHGGRLRGTWGDQVLLEFDSSRQALRAAADLRARCVDETVNGTGPPLAVGIGIDIGEPADEGLNRSAAALNVAARLCAKAAAGEVLATAELAHLAGTVEGLAYVDRGAARLKGMAAPTRYVLVRADDIDRTRERRFHDLVTESRRWRRDPRAWIAALVVLAVVAATAGVLISRTATDRAVTVPAGGVAVIDGGAARLVNAAEAGGAPEGVASGSGALWVAQSSADAVLRLDPDTKRVVQSVPVGSAPVAVAVTKSDVWAVNSQDGSVSRVSTTTNREVDRITGVGNQPVAIAAGLGSLWVANLADATVVRIDARTGRIDPTRVQVGRNPGGVAVGHGAVWVSNGGDGTVQRIDPTTMRADSPINVGAGPKGIAVAANGVWVANRNGLTVSHIDATSQQERAQINVGDSPFAVVASGDQVWVSVAAEGSLVRIDPATDTVTDTVGIGASPYGLAMVGSQVFASTRPFASAEHFGGTLRIAVGKQEGIPSTVDPAFVSDPNAARAMMSVYDGLVGYRRVGGVDSFDLVPDLAVKRPIPTDGGRTYTFALRPHIRYSDGRTVVPADFRRGIERVFNATRGTEYAGVAGYFSGIVGADACRARTCDLSAGIVTDASTVTFHLREADPEFLFKLVVVPASPVPPGVPNEEAGAGVVPGTGPYQVTAYQHGVSVRLERNPYFRPWSAAAQPRGYPDALQWKLGSPAGLIERVKDGGADLLDLRASTPSDAAELALQLPAQVHTSTVAKTVYLIPDMTRPPFDNKLAREALAVGIDRRDFVRDLPLYPKDETTCELLPARFPGYEPHCPFGSTPDIGRARDLVQRSGTRGDDVLVHTEFITESGRHSLMKLLRQIGYHPHAVPAPGDNASVTSGPQRANVLDMGWLPDWPAASQYFLPLLSCDAIKNGVNLGGYCNQRVDALAARAVDVAQSDPGAADRLWRQVYRVIADDAVIVPTDHGTLPFFVSKRVGNYQSGISLGPLLDQIWVR